MKSRIWVFYFKTLWLHLPTSNCKMHIILSRYPHSIYINFFHFWWDVYKFFNSVYLFIKRDDNVFCKRFLSDFFSPFNVWGDLVSDFYDLLICIQIYTSLKEFKFSWWNRKKFANWSFIILDRLIISSY